jgi:YgiT-type zinc finger domain-containing protein
MTISRVSNCTGSRPKDKKENSMTENARRCSSCGAELQRKIITYTQTIGDRVYLVTNVPAEVCFQCGEQYLSPDTVDILQDIIEKRQASETREVPVFHFPAA